MLSTQFLPSLKRRPSLADTSAAQGDHCGARLELPAPSATVCLPKTPMFSWNCFCLCGQQLFFQGANKISSKCGERFDCPLGVDPLIKVRFTSQVTITSNRAELVRTFKVTLQQGLNDIVVQNVSHSIESDSIRVDGSGAATIHEVQFKTDHVRQDEVDNPQVKELQIYGKRLDSLNDIIANLGKVSLKGEKCPELFSFDDSAEQALDKLYDFHEKKSVDVNSKVRQLNQEQENLQEEIRKLEQKISELRSGQSVKRSICITLESSDKVSDVVLDLSYQVYQARWQPSYDARVQTGDKTKFQLFYYGISSRLIWWCSSKVTYSKAQLVKPILVREPVQRAVVCGAPMARSKQLNYTYNANEIMEETMGSGGMQLEGVMPLSLQLAHVEKQVDTSEHKVTIAVLDLSSLLRLDCVPSKDTNVFVTATTINTTKYPLLAGTASVYVDNSFSSKVGNSNAGWDIQRWCLADSKYDLNPGAYKISSKWRAL
uniref:DUF4140 domain-containing protein n=1 Tax=Ditylenchus dipsaci TaxID=166011 RepID=A0A915DS88_9BILA